MLGIVTGAMAAFSTLEAERQRVRAQTEARRHALLAQQRRAAQQQANLNDAFLPVYGVKDTFLLNLTDGKIRREDHPQPEYELDHNGRRVRDYFPNHGKWGT